MKISTLLFKIAKALTSIQDFEKLIKSDLESFLDQKVNVLNGGISIKDSDILTEEQEQVFLIYRKFYIYIFHNFNKLYEIFDEHKSLTLYKEILNLFIKPFKTISPTLFSSSLLVAKLNLFFNDPVDNLFLENPEKIKQLPENLTMDKIHSGYQGAGYEDDYHFTKYFVPQRKHEGKLIATNEAVIYQHIIDHQKTLSPSELEQLPIPLYYDLCAIGKHTDEYFPEDTTFRVQMEKLQPLKRIDFTYSPTNVTKESFEIDYQDIEQGIVKQRILKELGGMVQFKETQQLNKFLNDITNSFNYLKKLGISASDFLFDVVLEKENGYLIYFHNIMKSPRGNYVLMDYGHTTGIKNINEIDIKNCD